MKNSWREVHVFHGHAFFSTENPPGTLFGSGAFIGLMMVPNTDAIAWDWKQNSNDGVNSTDHITDVGNASGVGYGTARGANANRQVPVKVGSRLRTLRS